MIGVETQKEAVRVGAPAWADLVVSLMVVSALASLGVGYGVSTAPEHGWPWIAAGALVGMAWIAGAMALSLLARIATR